MIPEIKIGAKDLPSLFEEYEIRDSDLEWLIEMSENGESKEALEILIDDYILPASVRYDSEMRKFLSLSESGIIGESDKNRLIRYVTVAGVVFGSVLISSYTKFVKNVYKNVIQGVIKLMNPEMRNALLKETISIYEESINKTIANTTSFVNGNIRSIQRKMTLEDYKIKKSGLKEVNLKEELSRFKSELRTSFPKVYSAIEEGKLIVSGGKHYRADYFFDASLRTTLLNYDRLANITTAEINNEQVLEYYLADDRTVVKEREICKEILTNKVLGKSILALNEEAANKLGIMTVQEAETTPDYALGFLCRHSLRRLGSDYLKQINEIIGSEQNA